MKERVKLRTVSLSANIWICEFRILTLVNLICLQVVVLCVGTNNYGHSAEQVAEAIMEIVSAIQLKQPTAQIVVMVSRTTPVKICSRNLKPFWNCSRKYRTILELFHLHDLESVLGTVPE